MEEKSTRVWYFTNNLYVSLSRIALHWCQMLVRRSRSRMRGSAAVRVGCSSSALDANPSAAMKADGRRYELEKNVLESNVISCVKRGCALPRVMKRLHKTDDSPRVEYEMIYLESLVGKSFPGTDRRFVRVAALQICRMRT